MWFKSGSLLPIIALFLLPGCMTVSEPQTQSVQDEPKTDSRTFVEIAPDHFPDSKAALKANLSKWNALSTGSYSFRQNRSCYCFPHGWMQVWVEKGSVTRLDSIPSLKSEFEPGQENSTPTIDHLFRLVAEYLENQKYSVAVSYNPALGYPSWIRISFIGAEELRDVDISMEVYDVVMQ